MAKAKSAPASPTAVLQTIETKSKQINQLATQLTDRILRFEEWLTKLPGKVEATYWLAPDPWDSSGVELGFHVHRSGKKWVLAYGHSRPDRDDVEIDWAPVSEASLDLKMLAVELIPQILESITIAQDKIAERLAAAHVKFDAFAQSVGIEQPKEGA